MKVPEPAADSRVLLLTATRRDADVSRRLLERDGLSPQPCRDLSDLCGELSAGAATLMVPEEFLVGHAIEPLAEMVRHQPVWSDLPIVVLTRGGVESPTVRRATALLGNVSLVERPVRVSTLLSVVRTAVRARQRQYQVRDQLVASEQDRRELEEAREAAEAASRSKDQFLAVLSHELRTPLSPVAMALSVLDGDASLPEPLAETVSMMRRNVALETQLIDDLLDVNRIVSGKLRLQVRPTSVHEVVRHAVETCRSELSDKSLDVQLDLAAGDDTAMADPTRLQQVFWNLLKNAAKFTPEGGGITLKSRNVDDAAIEVAVADTGVGIEPRALPHLFDAFDQGDWRTTQTFGGLGLGLAICRAVVGMLGGSISAHSDGRDCGATFRVSIPLTTRPVQAPHRRPSPALPTGEAVRILLVEDHADTGRLLAKLLRRAGHQVELAQSVAAALALARAEPFDLLISDIGLPDASGYDLLRELRKLDDAGRLPAIALSGYGTDDDLRRSAAAGFAEHVVKPVDLDQLLPAISRLATRP